jgi:DAACS family dicarboxylate/amino acid:cation (Na+ or H+) symporter
VADKPDRSWNPLRWPLYLRVIAGVVIGVCVGKLFGRGNILFGATTEDLATLGGLYIRFLTAMATPLIFFSIVDAFVKTHISGWKGIKMIIICVMNICVAFVIGLTILNVWQPGRTWEGTLIPRAAAASDVDQAKVAKLAEQAGHVSLSPLQVLDSYVPNSIIKPFSENTVLTVAALAILLGAAMRSLQSSTDVSVMESLATFQRVVTASFQIVMKILAWMIQLAPVAICFVIAGVIGATDDLSMLMERVGVYFATVMAALGIHALVYYPLTSWLIGGKSPLRFLREGAAAILTGFSINSSLATAPLTLRALDRLGVSESSARLSACVGTNFNNDGITLYEAITALFLTQAAGMHLGLGQQIALLVVVLAGSMGIAGIPNSGLLILTLVLRATRLPDEVVNLALPIVYSIDFINGRTRSAVNVMGDMQVAILLDAGAPKLQPAGTASEHVAMPQVAESESTTA